LALAQLPARLRCETREFCKLTGLVVTTCLRVPSRDSSAAEALPPPAHPLCAAQLRTVRNPPCHRQWEHHLLVLQESRRAHTHTCPLRLRCACVPIVLGGALVGVAKMVAELSTPERQFARAAEMLEATVALCCHRSCLSVLQAELRRHRSRWNESEDPAPDLTTAKTQDALATEDEAVLPSSETVDRALAVIHARYHEPHLSLRAIAADVGCSPRYLTHLFTRVVGRHMHAYAVGLRVEYVREELLKNGRLLKQIAYDAGFRDAAQLARAFRRQVGVTPSEYRRLFGIA